MRDLYEILQVHPRAEAEVVRAAYRTLARKYHPDHGGDAVRMTQINDAWDVLGDPARRAVYDASRTTSGPIRAAAAARSTERSPDRPSATTSQRPAERAAERPAEPALRSAPPPAQERESTVKYDPGAPKPADPGHMGPPPGRPSGSVLDFGRYAGWSLGEIARLDRDYMEWLSRSTIGRGFRAEIDALLRGQSADGAAAAPASSSRNWPRR
ncbi:MAG TPA: DnaJ domain-containing protein [Candidatus Limnocylindrales bacterium]